MTPEQKQNEVDSLQENIKNSEENSEQMMNECDDQSAKCDEEVQDLDALTRKIAVLEASLAEQKNKEQESVLRLKAESDNQRKRMQKEIEDARKFSIQRFIESLLPVIDSLEMGAQAEGDVAQIKQGFDLTLEQFQKVMAQFNLQAVGEENEVFNPEFHQAVAQQNSEKHENNHIMTVMQKGYVLNGRVIRAAMVMVCKKS